jgi:hypothetical protein
MLTHEIFSSDDNLNKAVEDLQNRIKHQPPQHDRTVAKHEDIRAAVSMLGKVILTLVPEGREQDLALTRLEEMLFWCNAGIARNQNE